MNTKAHQRATATLQPLTVATTWLLLALWALQAPVRAQTPQLHFPELASGASVGSGLTTPCLDAAPGTIHCGRFRVLENRDQPRGATIDLAFVVARATSEAATATDAVTFLLGGPGSSTTAPARGLIGAFAGLREQRDLLFLDHRGVGASGALSCEDEYPRGVESRVAELFPIDHAQACAKRLSERTQLDQYTSAASMDDLDELRTWLGYSQLNIYSGSYGTREVQVLLRRHPASVRTAVLLVVSPIFHKSYLSHARGLQDALDALVAECRTNAQCNSDYPGLDQELSRILAQAKTDPATVKAGRTPVAFGAGALGYALRGLLYRQGHDVPYFIHQAAQSNWQPLADYYLQRQSWVSDPGGETGYHFSVICAESIRFITDLEVAEQTKDTFLGSFLINAYRSVCRSWPHAALAASFLDPVKSNIPVLVLSGERDPVTPVSKGTAVAALLPNSKHVVVPNGGHGVFGPCYQEMINTLVNTGSVAKIDDSCVTEAGPTKFRRPAG